MKPNLKKPSDYFIAFTNNCHDKISFLLSFFIILRFLRGVLRTAFGYYPRCNAISIFLR